MGTKIATARLGLSATFSIKDQATLMLQGQFAKVQSLVPAVALNPGVYPFVFISIIPLWDSLACEIFQPPLTNEHK